MSEYAIVVKNVTKAFNKLEVLKGVNLEVRQGTVMGLLGPNGAGKTTMVKILSTLLQADGGEVKVNGFEVTHNGDEVRHSIGLAGQYAAVDEYLSGRDNLIMFGQLYHLPKATAAKRAQELLEQFDLVEAADRIAKTYSGGMRRRLDLAASLVATPPIIFLDEPTTGLDPRSRLAVWQIIKELKKSGVTILLTTQYLEEADKLADRIAVIDHGVVIAEGTPTELKDRVGKDRLEITVVRPEDFEKTVSVIEEKIIQHDSDEKRISISSNGTVHQIQKVLNRLEEAGIQIETLNLHKPTLDDVFLLLTGKDTTSEEAPKE